MCIRYFSLRNINISVVLVLPDKYMQFGGWQCAICSLEDVDVIKPGKVSSLSLWSLSLVCTYQPFSVTFTCSLIVYRLFFFCAIVLGLSIVWKIYFRYSFLSLIFWNLSNIFSECLKKKKSKWLLQHMILIRCITFLCCVKLQSHFSAREQVNFLFDKKLD